SLDGKVPHRSWVTGGPKIPRMAHVDSGRPTESLCVSRSKALLLAVLLVAAVALGATAAPARSGGQNEKQLFSLNRQVATAINAFRRAHGLARLRVSRGLNASARQHSKEMGTD